MNVVDEFIVYDEIQYSKKSWVNRNRILMNNSDHLISLPLKKGSDYLNIKDRFLADNWPLERKKLLAKIYNSYRKAPEFKNTYPLVESIINFDTENLFDFLLNNLLTLKNHLEIDTRVVVSSSIPYDNELRAEKKVIEICKKQDANQYVNPIGGTELYDKSTFQKEGIQLDFVKTSPIEYDQHGSVFIPNLSIVDVMMFNCKAKIKELLNKEYTLV